MNQFALGLYAVVNVAMIASFLLRKFRIYEFPFWAGILAMGWFYPQAESASTKVDAYPAGAYANGLLFASICTVALWIGYAQGVRAEGREVSWLDMRFNPQRMVVASAFLCIAGFFFQWKLMSLPEELLAQTQWTGAAVKYLFLASVFQFGFLALWLLYLEQDNFLRIDLLLFIVPSLFSILTAAMHGRRALMMNAFAYVFVSLWFARRIVLPRWLLVLALALGVTLVSAIGVYRTVMDATKDKPFAERLNYALKATFEKALLQKEPGQTRKTDEFNNYIYGRAAHSATGKHDWGLQHWNGVVFNYVPGQIVGSAFKKSLMVPLDHSLQLAKQKYGYVAGVGTTSTGYLDAFASFGWLGFVKFWFIGGMMGILYRRAMGGAFLPQLLYVYLLGTAMHAVSHGTQNILFSKWIYFFALGFPAFLWARDKLAQEGVGTHNQEVPSGIDL